jgi:hypothetical protein
MHLASLRKQSILLIVILITLKQRVLDMVHMLLTYLSVYLSIHAELHVIMDVNRIGFESRQYIV